MIYNMPSYWPSQVAFEFPFSNESLTEPTIQFAPKEDE